MTSSKRHSRDQSHDFYIGRELSWLRFNERVLLQADDPNVPLLERIRFCAIFTSNFDEFFMVRAGSLHDRSLLPSLPPDNKTGLSAAEQLTQLYKEARRLYVLRDRIFKKLSSELAESGVIHAAWSQLSKEEKKAVRHFFKKDLAPLTSPYIIDAKHPFPHLENKQVHVLLALSGGDSKVNFGILPIPHDAQKIFTFHDADTGSIRYLTAEDILLHEADELFSNYDISSKLLIKVTRNADIEVADNFSDDPDHELDYPTYLKILLKKRDKLGAVRLEFNCDNKCSPQKPLAFIKGKLGLVDAQIYRSESPISYAFSTPLIKEAMSILANSAYVPIPQISRKFDDIFCEISKNDILLSYPYHSMRTYLDFLHEAAFNPSVHSIRITLYRLAEHSEIISLLRAAAENGKHVTAVVELKARFDEENNIHWARLLEDAGCHVIYGMNGLKVHSKVTLVTVREDTGIRHYAHIGTGNYNEQTAKLYTDLSILTADPILTEDADKLFDSLCAGTPTSDYRELLVSPTTLKPRILSEIETEKRLALSGKKAYICMKMNGMTDKDIIDALIAASRAGVKIDLIIRGICCLKTGIPGMTDNIRVVSIVGRYLEHSRIFIFGHIDDNVLTKPPRVYIGSADMMTRNTTRRIEVITPIKDSRIAGKLISLTRLELRDNQKLSTMQPDGTYIKTESNGEPFDSQMELYNLHK